MGRFETLNAETQDLVECLLPALAASFKVNDVVDIIPQDIRMRQWDTERRDHIKSKTENDPRNWGVQFLKDLKTIARLTGGDLQKFHEELYEKVALHEESHPWCRLADIKEIKLDCENPGRKEAMANPVQVISEDSSTDSYLEELVEPDMPRGSSKRSRHEVYEARVQESSKRRKKARLRRADDGGFIRPDKAYKQQRSEDRGTSILSNRSLRRSSSHNRRRRETRVIPSDGEDSYGSPGAPPVYPRSTPRYSVTPAPHSAQPDYMAEVNASNEPLAVQRLAAELEVAEAELKAARLKYQYIQAREQAEQEGASRGSGSY
ncbi:hypothetical protein T440DRAFT_464904 [Plenodomus tracheiphilus IPT5]|uniref:Uncharacterized protein n=1 Tax=Plenodomus tracheiphilus IPT5 TaxID=1408161 RepID=A0A6A7BH60_9PLEO|nr:hypothetical protein T440DRAFT_464904 [Plenodomus tracheiphilus IPT5]